MGKEIFPPTTRNKTRTLTFTTTLQQNNWGVGRIGIQIVKEEIKLYVLTIHNPICGKSYRSIKEIRANKWIQYICRLQQQRISQLSFSIPTILKRKFKRTNPHLQQHRKEYLEINLTKAWMCENLIPEIN